MEVEPGFVRQVNRLHCTAASAAAAAAATDVAYDVLLLHNEDVLGQRHKRRKIDGTGTAAEEAAGGGSRAGAGAAEGESSSPSGLAVAEEATPYCAAACAYVVSRRWAMQLLARRYPVRLPVDFYMVWLHTHVML